MKVAIIEPVGGHGGMNYYDFAFCHGLVKSGVDVTLYTCNETKVPHSLAFTIKWYFQKIYGSTPKYIRALYYLLGLVRSLTDARWSKVKLAHFHFFHTSLLEWISINLAKLFSFKIVVTVHDVESLSGDSRQVLAQTIYHACDLVIVHNQISCKELSENCHVPRSKIRVISHGNYINYIEAYTDQQQAREKLMLAEAGPFLLFFGQIKEVKGLDILINALPTVIQIFPSLKLVVAGKVWKDNITLYQSLVEKYKLSKNVIFHTYYIPDELVNYYYQASDLVVLPYRRVYQSGVLLMAMSFGCPVLVSDLEGMTEVIQDDINGFVFHQGDSEHLAQKLVEILSDTKKVKQIAKVGYITACNYYNWDQIGHQTTQAYSEITY